MNKCYGHLKTYPPYIGGDDDDEIEFYIAYCMCQWEGERRSYAEVAQHDLIRHLNEQYLPDTAGNGDSL